MKPVRGLISLLPVILPLVCVILPLFIHHILYDRPLLLGLDLPVTVLLRDYELPHLCVSLRLLLRFLFDILDVFG